MTSSYTILLLFQVEIHSTIIFISQQLVYFNHITSNIRLHRVQKKRCHWFFCCNFYKYWRIFIIFVHNFARKCQSHWRKNLLPHIHYVATIPCESLRHKSNTFHTNISTLHMFISITFTKTSIDETNKTQQKVRGSKFMFKMSTIHANTCIQTTRPLRNRWWFRWQCPVLVLRSCTSWNQGLRSTVTITGMQFC